jgi:hypothetical protein
MPCYKEFPEQVIKLSSEFINNNELSLAEIKNDYYVRFKSTDWNVVFICEYGAIEINLINQKDGFQYELSSVFESLNLESDLIKEFAKNTWSSEESIEFWIKVLTEFYPFLVKQYKSLKEKISEHKSRSYILIDFALNKGSNSLKSEFTWSNDNWIEKASEEYIRNKN